MSQEAKENTERIEIICWTGHKRKKRELDKRQEKRWVRTTSVSMAGLPTPTDTVGIYDPGLMPSIRDISPDTEPVRDFLLEQGKQKHSSESFAFVLLHKDATWWHRRRALLHVFSSARAESVLDLGWPGGLRVWLHITFPPFPKSKWNCSKYYR